jgi:molybdopterin molybdotransferase
VVEPGLKPAAGQIRNSNGPMISACVASAGAAPVSLGIGRDNADELRRLVAKGLENDMLVLMGGVSAGTRDLVPEVLAEQGVKALFHKIRLKPGKPLLFGIVEQPQGAAPKLIFGLPGNPVSGLVCFELFVRPAIKRLGGHPQVGPDFFPARLARDFAHRGDRPTYHPARLRVTPEGWQVDPVDWQGSPDLRGASMANALACFPPGDRKFAAGEAVEVLPLQ